MSVEIAPQIQDKLYLPRADEFVEEALANYGTGSFSDQLAATPRGHGYHVRPHGQQVHDITIINRTILLEAGTPETEVPSLFVSRTGAAAHDEAYFKYFSDPKVRANYQSPEAYAMYLYAERAKKYKIDNYTVEEGKRVIQTTQAGKQCLSWGQFIVCEADVHLTTLEDTSQMDENTEVLHGEYSVINKSKINKLGYDLLSLGVLKTINLVNMNYSPIDELEYFRERREQMRQNLENKALGILAAEYDPEVIVAAIETDVPEVFRSAVRELMNVAQLI